MAHKAFCPQEMVDWFNALRAARFHYLQVAFPGASDLDVSGCPEVMVWGVNVLALVPLGWGGVIKDTHGPICPQSDHSHPQCSGQKGWAGTGVTWAVGRGKKQQGWSMARGVHFPDLGWGTGPSFHRGSPDAPPQPV